jgi:hypothetical protein
MSDHRRRWCPWAAWDSAGDHNNPASSRWAGPPPGGPRSPAALAWRISRTRGSRYGIRRPGDLQQQPPHLQHRQRLPPCGRLPTILRRRAARRGTPHSPLSPPAVRRATEMRVLKLIRILETEGEHSVHPDVPEPHEAQGQPERTAFPPSVPHHQRRQRGGVSHVVDMRADSRTCQIASHEEVGKEQDKRYQPPRSVRGGKGNE